MTSLRRARVPAPTHRSCSTVYYRSSKASRGVPQEYLVCMQYECHPNMSAFRNALLLAPLAGSPDPTCDKSDRREWVKILTPLTPSRDSLLVRYTARSSAVVGNAGAQPGAQPSDYPGARKSGTERLTEEFRLTVCPASISGAMHPRRISTATR